MASVFLDHQSSTPVLPEAFEAMRRYALDEFGNPSSLHRYGVRARQALATAREQFAALVGAPGAEDIIFTSGGTESANLAVKGVAWASLRRGNHLVVSAIEHPAILKSVEFLEKHGFTSTRLPVDGAGFVYPEAVRQALRDDTVLVCIQHASPDVGTIQPIRDIAAITSERGIPLFVDASASAGWIPLDVRALGIDLLSLTAHRFYGPKGCGALYRRRGVPLVSLIHGGEQEAGRRAGTENVPAIVGAGVAAEFARREVRPRQEHTGLLQRRLWELIQSTVSQVELNGPNPGAQRLSTNLNVSARFAEGEGQMLSLDMAGVAVTSGATCASKAIKHSPVLQAMGLGRDRAESSVVFSLGKDNSTDDIDRAAVAYAKSVERLRSLSPEWEESKKMSDERAQVTDGGSASPAPQSTRVEGVGGSHS